MGRRPGRGLDGDGSCVERRTISLRYSSGRQHPGGQPYLRNDTRRKQQKLKHKHHASKMTATLFWLNPSSPTALAVRKREK